MLFSSKQEPEPVIRLGDHHEYGFKYGCCLVGESSTLFMYTSGTLLSTPRGMAPKRISSYLHLFYNNYTRVNLLALIF